MKRYKKLICHSVSLVFAISLLLQLTACMEHEQLEVEEEDKMKGELSVYYVDYADQTSGYTDAYETTLLVQDLQNKYPDLELKLTTFGSREAFMLQVSTELNGGGGPDLFLLNYATQLNWNKMVNNGSFENLSPYIKKDESYNNEDYFGPVIKAGQIDGNQFALPLAFNCISLFTSKEKLAENSVSFELDYTYKDILSLLTDSVKRADEDDNIIPLALSLERDDFLTCFMQAFGMPFVDYAKKSVALDKQSLLEVCDFMKIFYPYSGEAFANKADNASQTQNAKKVAYSISSFSYVGEEMQQKAIQKRIDKEAVSIIMPKYDSPNESTAYVYHYATVNSNSKNKQLAYDTAKALMDIAGGDNIDQRFPVNKGSFDLWLQGYKNGVWNTKIDGTSVPVGDEVETEKIIKKVENFEYVTMENFDVMSIVNKCMSPYIEGDTKTFDECYEETVNKLNLYINE